MIVKKCTEIEMAVLNISMKFSD